MAANEITAYALAKELNVALAAAGIDQQVKPQMMYNYVKNGLIAKNSNGKISRATANAFIKKFVAKRAK